MFFPNTIHQIYLSIYRYHFQGVTEHQKSMYINMDGLLDTLKFVHKMFYFMEFWWTVCKNIILALVHVLVLLYKLFIKARI
jgi:hypothetical protein